VKLQERETDFFQIIIKIQIEFISEKTKPIKSYEKSILKIRTC